MMTSYEYQTRGGGVSFIMHNAHLSVVWIIWRRKSVRDCLLCVVCVALGGPSWVRLQELNQ